MDKITYSFVYLCDVCSSPAYPFGFCGGLVAGSVVMRMKHV
jgi:hypothetical protein